MIKYIDKGTARQHLTDRLMESALNNAGFREDADAVFLDIAKNRLPVWLDELPTYDVAEVVRCKECVFHSDSFILNGKRKCNIFCMCTDDGFYCGFGEKMDEVTDGE